MNSFNYINIDWLGTDSTNQACRLVMVSRLPLPYSPCKWRRLQHALTLPFQAFWHCHWIKIRLNTQDTEITKLCNQSAIMVMMMIVRVFLVRIMRNICDSFCQNMFEKDIFFRKTCSLFKHVSPLEYRIFQIPSRNNRLFNRFLPMNRMICTLFAVI